MKLHNEKATSEDFVPYSRPSDAADSHLRINSFQEAANATLENAGKTGKGEKVLCFSKILKKKV